MLIKCPECLKDISSEATQCIHCGFPIKKTSEIQHASQPETTTSSTFGLGVSFIVLGIAGLIGGVIAIQPSEIEGLQDNLVGLHHSFDRTYLDGKTTETRDAESKLSDLGSERHVKAACWFIPGALLLMTGSIMCSVRTKMTSGDSHPPRTPPVEAVHIEPEVPIPLEPQEQQQIIVNEKHTINWLPVFICIIGIALLVLSIWIAMDW